MSLFPSLGVLACLVAGSTLAAERSAAVPTAVFRQYCFGCHGKGAGMAGINLEQMTSQHSMDDKFREWGKVAAALDQKKMPPEKMPQPSNAERQQAAAWIRASLHEQASRNAGDPGRVTVRRLTSGEYGYAIQDLTGLDLNVQRDLMSDEVGGEGFTNFGDVQFLQDAGLERYLEMAKRVASHAVIGSGPIGFYGDAGKTGFELSAVSRIQEIYRANGFRTVSGEGGMPFGLDRYGKALYAAWRYRHRAALGEGNATLAGLAANEGIQPVFAQHVWSVLHQPSLRYPSSEVAARWRNLPAPAAGPAAARAQCEEIQKFLVTWPSWLFARGDLAAGGAGDERPLVFSDASLKVDAKRRFRFFRGFRGGGRGPAAPAGGTARVYFNAVLANPDPGSQPMLIWRNPTIQFRKPGERPAAAVTGAQLAAGEEAVRRFGGRQDQQRLALRTLLTEESAAKLAFGKSLDGSEIGPEDFASAGPVFFDVKLPDGMSMFDLQVDAEIGAKRDQVIRITMSDRADGSTRGVPVWGLVGDPQSAGFKSWKEGVLEFARLLPPNSHGEPTPADKDPIPEPFDNTYNVPEHDEFVVKVKYTRDDRFVAGNMVDKATRKRLDDAWNDLYASFDYHTVYLRLLAKKFHVDLQGKTIAEMDRTRIATLPAELGKYVTPIRARYEAVTTAQAAAQPGHVEDCVRFASRAWRRPLSERERQNLRAFYAATMQSEQDHRKAIRALLARILVAPAFLYKVEQSAQASALRPLTSWEMASRMSFFLWSSVPDEELRRAAVAGELNDPRHLRTQVQRMLADARARRLSTEFFGQWLGFYRFDQHRGVDTSRFPEFTAEVKSAMYDEAVSFFAHVVRKDRPIREILHGDYSFLNQPLAKFYGVKKAIKSKEQVELVNGAGEYQRGGLLRLGAVLTATSAPLRTSPVKRGDWVLRRVLGTPTPPPPADAGSIPADEKLFGGLTLRERLQSHQRNPSCAGCHSRIDPLGFPLEKYDAVGRWRDTYSDGKPIQDSAAFAGGSEVSGVDGLLKYLDTNQDQVARTLSQKLLGYALGRTIVLQDQPLIDRMAAGGGDARIADLAEQIVTSRQFRNRRELEDVRAPRTTVHPVAKNMARIPDRTGAR